MPGSPEDVTGRAPAARLLDHEGNWTPPFEVTETVTCRGADRTWDHRLFGINSLHPGDNLFQAMTFCGKRALEVPGLGSAVTCPKCLDYMAEEGTTA